MSESRLAIDANASVVIRQVYGGGSNSGAPHTHDFIEIFNRSAESVSLAGWSLQYASATGTGNLGANAGQLTELPDVMLAPGQAFLVQESGTGASSLPSADVVDPTPINLSATAGKVALVRQATSIGCNGGSTPCSAAAEALIVDLVGYGTANYFETAPAPGLGNTSAAQRAGSGCTDTNDNAADFSAGAVDPRNSAFASTPCGGDPGGGGGNGGGGNGGAAGAAGAGMGGVGAGGAPPVPGPMRIHDIQGRAHRSPLEGSEVVNVPGVATRVRSNGFFLQDPEPDADDATSEALFVFTASAPGIAVGDAVLVSGRVTEFRPGNAAANLTTTEIERPSFVHVVSSGNALPAATLVGAPGRVAPAQVIDDDRSGDVESAAATFTPDSDAIDFYESLEAMRVEVRDAVATGPTNAFNEISVLPSNGAGAGLRTARGGIVIAANDFNPERVILDGETMPQVDVGDAFPGSVFAVVDYTFGNFKLDTDSPPAVVRGGLARESVAFPAARANHLNVASFNVENLDPGDPPEKFAALARLLVENLGAPDLVALEEVQDDNGATNNGVVTSGTTIAALKSAIQAAGGPAYDSRSIDPVDGQDGGEPGGNIRVAFLFRTDRGLVFVDRPGAGSTTANAVLNAGGTPRLTFSPGRIDPANGAFANSRKPLAAELTFNGRTLFVVANHFNSKGGDDPLFGRVQPPFLSSEAQRRAQAQAVAGFVAQIAAIDADAATIVLGDLNDFEFSAPIGILKGAGLATLVETLPPAERYTYVFEGNSQVLDHVMVSASLRAALAGFDVVHVNAEFADQASDHDPAIARFTLGGLPTRGLIPILECVTRNGFASWTAHFGYDNPNALPVTRPVSALNRFLPNPADRRQPRLFAPGRQRNVFQVPFRPLESVTWLLDGRIQIGTILAPRCR